MKTPFIWPQRDQWILGALSEDVGSGDVTTQAVISNDSYSEMNWTAKSPLIVCGILVCARVFELVDPSVEVGLSADEGKLAKPGEIIMTLKGPTAALLVGERTALNMAQHMSGIANQTRAFVDAVAGTDTKIAATRKTVPHMRRLAKYAVTIGGGVPHRFGLDDGVLIKDNHITAAGSISEAVKMARSRIHHLIKIEVEVESIEQAEEAVSAGADILLLDNMTTEQLEEAVKHIDGRAVCEASGNMTLERVPEVAKTGVDIISVGALTHSVIAADISARTFVAVPSKKR